ncbi:FCD domain-containing protein [Mesorhizobium sp.]|uniref:FCD domain-containing protein n=1 Tax=Mesorhizobium sp. TaxID=1871066 RepID=UPI000FE88BA7|nr:MAG: GntR family transcriptional regulator [Mesorhizobium sp.]
MRIHQREFLRAEDQQDWKKALSANQSFHFSIYRKSNNRVLVRVIENLWLLAGPFVSNQYPLTKQLIFDVHPHDRIIDALKRPDAVAAGELIVRDLLECEARAHQPCRCPATWKSGCRYKALRIRCTLRRMTAMCAGHLKIPKNQPTGQHTMCGLLSSHLNRLCFRWSFRHRRSSAFVR